MWAQDGTGHPKSALSKNNTISPQTCGALDAASTSLSIVLKKKKLILACKHFFQEVIASLFHHARTQDMEAKML